MTTINITINKQEQNNLEKYSKTTRFDLIDNNQIIGQLRILKSFNTGKFVIELLRNSIIYYVYDYYGIVNDFNIPFGFNFAFAGGILTINIPDGVL